MLLLVKQITQRFSLFQSRNSHLVYEIPCKNYRNTYIILKTHQEKIIWSKIQEGRNNYSK